MDNGRRLYICGTNAHNPKDYVVYVSIKWNYTCHVTDNDGNPSFCTLQSNLTDLPRSEYVPGIGLGIGKCPYDPLDNSTAIYVEKGNPDDLPALVSTRCKTYKNRSSNVMNF